MIDLTKFCSDEDWRAELAKPFTSGDYTYATNGHILIRVPKQDGHDNSGPDLTKILPRLEAGLLEPMQPLPPYGVTRGEVYPEPDCGDCEGSGRVKVCLPCGGTGQRECGECGGEKDCDPCDGKGYFLAEKGDENQDIAECDECNGTGKWDAPPSKPSRARFETHDFNKLYIDMIADLPGLRVSFGAPMDAGYMESALAFTFDGGAGLLMPMRRDETETTTKEEVSA